jgi:hypothetical protein
MIESMARDDRTVKLAMPGYQGPLIDSVFRSMNLSVEETPDSNICIPMPVAGTKRTCRSRLTMSAPEGKTDVPREPGRFRF